MQKLMGSVRAVVGLMVVGIEEWTLASRWVVVAVGMSAVAWVIVRESCATI